MKRVLLFIVIVLLFGIEPGKGYAFEAEFLAGSETELENPHDVKLSPDGKWLYVSDVGYDRVVVLDAQTLEKAGDFGSDHQDGTHDVDFDDEGRLYVADTHNHRIAIYDLDGLTARYAGELSGGFRKPEGVLVGPEQRVYITGAGSHNLVVFEGGKVVQEMGGLSAPHDLEFAPNGDIWIADAGNDRLIRVTRDLQIVEVLEGPPYDFRGPRYMDIAPDGTIFLADKYSHQLKVIAEDGRLLGKLGSGSAGQGPEQFRTPEGVELKDEFLWIADSGNDRIVKYRISY